MNLFFLQSCQNVTLLQLLTDYWYGAFADEQARYHSPTADTYYFEFNYRSVVYDVTPEWAGIVQYNNDNQGAKTYIEVIG